MTLTRDEIRAKVVKQFDNQLPSPPTPTYRGVINDLTYWDTSLTEQDVREIIASAVPVGWEVRRLDRVPRRDRKWWLYEIELRRVAEATPPYSAADVLREYEACDGDWQAAAIVLGEPYRSFRRWMTHPSMDDLAVLWEEERLRVAARERGEDSPLWKGTYLPEQRAADTDELERLGREHPQSADIVRAMLRQLDEGRTWPPVGVLRRYCETGNTGLVSHLEGLGWI